MQADKSVLCAQALGTIRQAPNKVHEKTNRKASEAMVMVLFFMRALLNQWTDGPCRGCCGHLF
jgi:hypothetical protein